MSTSTIAHKVGEMRRDMAERPHDKILEVFEREQSTLASMGEPGGALAVGSTVPDVKLIDPEGVPTSLAEVMGNRPSVVVFYRGAWCPYCNLTLSNYQATLLPALADRGAQLIAVSPQRPDGSLTVQQKHDLTFAVLSDPGNSLARALGIVTAPSSEVRAAQLELGLDLAAVNMDGTTSLPWPTTTILDRGRALRWIDVHPDYSTRSEASDIVAALDALNL